MTTAKSLVSGWCRYSAALCSLPHISQATQEITGCNLNPLVKNCAVRVNQFGGIGID